MCSDHDMNIRVLLAAPHRMTSLAMKFLKSKMTQNTFQFWQGNRFSCEFLDQFGNACHIVMVLQVVADCKVDELRQPAGFAAGIGGIGLVAVGLGLFLVCLGLRGVPG